ncbi:hypothetical protein DY000_02038579 [Brassica cretica]|uniref:NYN domain-containing protein n=1 Tax=Brassica cretica TaxID=69181 RepID=A0ABQ7BH14_BRACR|nr:hypothetical protein DY000_02038579 [Brassica cretica]
MKDGVYTARRLVLISGDKGFRDVVDDLRSKEMVVYFIKPERNVCAPLTSGAQSIYLSEGKYNNWHIVAKTRSEKVQDRKRARNERMHLERQVGRMAIGEGFETEFKQTDHGKEILRRDPSFSLNDFADKVHDNINRVLSAYTKSKGNSVTLEKYCNEKCTLSARSFKRAGSSFQSQDCAYIRSQRSRGKDDGNYAHNHRQVQDKRNLQSEQQERHDTLGARPPVDNATNGRMGMESQRYRKMKSTQNIL